MTPKPSRRRSFVFGAVLASLISSSAMAIDPEALGIHLNDTRSIGRKSPYDFTTETTVTIHDRVVNQYAVNEVSRDFALTSENPVIQELKSYFQRSAKAGTEPWSVLEAVFARRPDIADAALDLVLHFYGGSPRIAEVPAFFAAHSEFLLKVDPLKAPLLAALRSDAGSPLVRKLFTGFLVGHEGRNVYRFFFESGGGPPQYGPSLREVAETAVREMPGEWESLFTDAAAALDVESGKTSTLAPKQFVELFEVYAAHAKTSESAIRLAELVEKYPRLRSSLANVPEKRFREILALVKAMPASPKLGAAMEGTLIEGYLSSHPRSLDLSDAWLKAQLDRLAELNPDGLEKLLPLAQSESNRTRSQSAFRFEAGLKKMIEKAKCALWVTDAAPKVN